MGTIANVGRLAGTTTTWLTPRPIIDALGGWQSFDLDPCASPRPHPWATARRMNTLADADGLEIEWEGRIWLNPPYGRAMPAWLWRLAGHGSGTALIFARTDTQIFRRAVFECADGLMFVYGRMRFADEAGEFRRRPSGAADGGAPSVLVAYGQEDLDRLAASEIEGCFVPLQMPRFLLVDLPTASWSAEMRAWLERQAGPIRISDAYRHFARHPKARRNPNWQAKVRQQLREVGERVGPATYRARA